MPFTPPTTAEFKTRFPIFASVADSVVQSALDEAATRVDDSWVDQANFTLGRMLYAAHVLTMDGHGTGSEAKAVAGGLAGVKSYRSGTFSVDRGGAADAGGGTDPLMRTSFGQRFLELVRLNFPAITIV